MLSETTLGKICRRGFAVLAMVSVMGMFVSFSPKEPHSFMGLFGLKAVYADVDCTTPKDAAEVVKCQLQAAKDAAKLPDAGITPSTDVASQQNTINIIIGRFLNPLLGFLGAIFLILTIYAGVLWMTAQGNEEKVTKARGIITMAVIGLAVVASAYIVVNFVIENITNAFKFG